MEKKNIEKENKQKGFTLIELLITISIIVFLASVVLASLQNTRKTSRCENGEIEYCEDGQKPRSCKEKFGECKVDCGKDNWIETKDELDLCLEKCSLVKEGCSLK